MGCNCKTQNDQQNVGPDMKLNKKIINYTLRSVVFLFSLILLPIILVASIWFMFRTLVLNKEVDIIGMLSLINDKFKSNKNDDDDDEYYDEDDYELVDVDYLETKTN